MNELHTLFCKNGYMQKFNKLSDDWNSYLARDRALTCPVAEDVKQVLDDRREEKKQQEARRNGELKTRLEDEKERERERRAANRWRLGFFLGIPGAIVATLSVFKLVGWW